MLQQHLSSQFIGNPHRLQRIEPPDALGLVGVLGVARALPIPSHERADAARDHGFMVATVAEGLIGVDPVSRVVGSPS